MLFPFPKIKFLSIPIFSIFVRNIQLKIFGKESKTKFLVHILAKKIKGISMSAQFLPSILVPLVGLVFPAVAMASMFLYIEKEEIN